MISRNVHIAGSVIAFHIAALWVMQSSLLRRAVELLVPAEILVGFIAPPAPKVAPVATPPAPARVELPSSDADYLQNPKPPDPPLSKRPGEQGKVLVRVFIEADGKANKAEIKPSSDFERLDQSALATVLRWRYVPGKRAGMPEAIWFNVPISFVLE